MGAAGSYPEAPQQENDLRPRFTTVTRDARGGWHRALLRERAPPPPDALAARPRFCSARILAARPPARRPPIRPRSADAPNPRAVRRLFEEESVDGHAQAASADVRAQPLPNAARLPQEARRARAPQPRLARLQGLREQEEGTTAR